LSAFFTVHCTQPSPIMIVSFYVCVYTLFLC